MNEPSPERGRPGLWRIVAVGLPGLYFAAATFLVLAQGDTALWEPLHPIAIADPSFTDMRSVTSGWECTREGIDVMRLNPCDFLTRPMNYPRVWMAPALLGLGDGAAPALGIATGVLFLAAVYAVLRGIDRLGALLALGFLFSYPVAFGVERGNVDLLVFALVVLVMTSWLSPRRQVAAPGLLLLATVLKLYPAFAAIAFLRTRGRDALLMFGTVTGAAAVYAFAIRGDLALISAGTPRPTGKDAYGAGVLAASLRGALEGTTDPPVEATFSMRLAVTVVVLLLGVVAGLAFAWRNRRPAPGSDRHAAFFWAGAGIYLGTFAIGHNFDYRLVFLILLLPQTFAWLRGPSAYRFLAATGYVSMVVAGWAGAYVTPVDDIAHVVLVAFAVTGLAATRPVWVDELLSRRAPVRS